MTITPPAPAGPISVEGITSVFRGQQDVQPFTYRSGMTYTQVLESMRAWTQNVLVPYLNTNFEDLQGSWVENVTSFVETINAGLATQSADNDAKIQAALDAIANADIQITDPAMTAVLNQASSAFKTALNTYADGRYAPKLLPGTATELKDAFAPKFLPGTTTELSAAFAGINRYYAPDPSGGDDTAVLQALVNKAMTSTGTGSGPAEVVLQYGTYRANLSTNPGFWQPIIRGRGLQGTVVQAFDGTKPVFLIQGTSGSYTGGKISNLTVAGVNRSTTTSYTGTGIEIQGACAFQVEGVQFINLVTGLLFHNTSAGMFTEFCVAKDCSWSYTQLAIKYVAESGAAESFHGSGVDGNSAVNLPPGAEFMDISTGAFVYNSPLNVTVFTSGTGAGNFIVNRSARPALFYGTMRLELQSTGGDWTVGWGGGGYVFLVGSVMGLGAGATAKIHLGQLFMCQSVEGTGLLMLPLLKPWKNMQTLNTGTSPVMGAPVYQGAYLGNIDITGPNGYWYSYTLLMWNSGTSVPATVTVLGTHTQTNPTGGPGAPTFSWNNGLQVTNAAYNTNYTCTGTFTPLTHANGGDNLGQY